MKERNLNLDVLRIIACFMVVFLHVASKYYSTTSIESFNWIVYNLYDCFVRSAVPLFVMMSGIFFLDPKKKVSLKVLYKKYIGRLVWAYVVWSAIYTFYDVCTGNVEPSLHNVIQTWIEGPKHLWYIPMLIGLYMISPFLKKITELVDHALIKYGIVLFIAISVLWTIVSFSFLPGHTTLVLLGEQLPFDLILQYTSYFLLGWFLNHYSFPKKIKRIMIGSGIASPFVCAGLTTLISNLKGSANSVLLNNFSIFTLTEAMAIFKCFDRKVPYWKKWRKEIRFLSSCTLGVYLSHILVLRIIASCIDLQSFNAVWMVPVFSVIVFICSVVLTSIMKQIKGLRVLV